MRIRGDNERVNLSEEGVGEHGAEGVDAVGVCFAVRVGEVAKQHDGSPPVRISNDACPGESRFTEGMRRNLGAHELGAIQLPAESGAGVFCRGILASQIPLEGILAHHLQNTCRHNAIAIVVDAVF